MIARVIVGILVVSIIMTKFHGVLYVYAGVILLSGAATLIGLTFAEFNAPSLYLGGVLAILGGALVGYGIGCMYGKS